MAASRLLQGMLFGITPLDLQTFGAVAVGFGLATTVAPYVPARRATRIDPNVALRAEQRAPKRVGSWSDHPPKSGRRGTGNSGVFVASGGVSRG